MSNTIDCPHCEKPNIIDECMGDSETQEMTCRCCDKSFEVTCTLIAYYTANCMEGDHNFTKLTGEFEGYQQCATCDHFEIIPKG